MTGHQLHPTDVIPIDRITLTGTRYCDCCLYYGFGPDGNRLQPAAFLRGCCHWFCITCGKTCIHACKPCHDNQKPQGADD